MVPIAAGTGGTGAHNVQYIGCIPAITTNWSPASYKPSTASV